MDIFKKIEQIREKPEHIRRRYVGICVFISIIIIGGIWVITLKGSYGNFGEIKKDEEYLQIMNTIKDSTSDKTESYTDKSEVVSTEEESVIEEDEASEKKYNLFDLSQ